jgi:fructokinase
MRIGIDLGGTKIEAIVMGPRSQIVHRERVATPRGDYAGTIEAIGGLVERAQRAVGATGPLPVGIGHPGAISPATGLLKNSNSTELNGEPLKQDLERRLARPVRLANDADCLALSEASDGAAAGAAVVFAAILGTGVGGGVVIGGQLLQGANAIAGEWGHNPMPWPRPEWDEVPGPKGWHHTYGDIEAYCSGPGLAADYERVAGEKRTTHEIVESAARDERAAAALARWEDRLARALATVINVLDPHVIVVGGGLSRIDRLYANVPKLWDAWVFSDRVDTRLVPALHGDSSGVRGAAWLWPER